MSERTVRRAIVVLVLLQAAVLLTLPLRAGPRIPSGATSQLAATEARPELKGLPSEPSNELFLDYGFDEVELPRGLEEGDTVYVEVLDGEGSRPDAFGMVVRDVDDLPAGATWLKLPVYGIGRYELGDGPLQVYYSEDSDRIAALRSHLEADDDNEVLVTIELDNDGDPTIVDVERYEPS